MGAAFAPLVSRTAKDINVYKHRHTMRNSNHSYNQTIIVVLSLLVALVLPAGTAWAGTLSLHEVVKNVQKRYEHTRDLQADFTQTATIKSVNQTLTEKGKVFFKKPKRMLWDYSTPSNKKLVINPHTAWLYIPEDNLVYVQSADKILTSKMTVRFMTGIGNLEDDFTITMSPHHTNNDESGDYVLMLVPLSKETGVETLFMTIHEDTFYVTAFSFTDIYGNVTSLTFTKIQTNRALPDSMFTFTPPPGVEIFEVP